MLPTATTTAIFLFLFATKTSIPHLFRPTHHSTQTSHTQIINNLHFMESLGWLLLLIYSTLLDTEDQPHLTKIFTAWLPGQHISGLPHFALSSSLYLPCWFLSFRLSDRFPRTKPNLFVSSAHTSPLSSSPNLTTSLTLPLTYLMEMPN